MALTTVCNIDLVGIVWEGLGLPAHFLLELPSGMPNNASIETLRRVIEDVEFQFRGVDLRYPIENSPESSVVWVSFPGIFHFSSSAEHSQRVEACKNEVSALTGQWARAKIHVQYRVIPASPRYEKFVSLRLELLGLEPVAEPEDVLLASGISQLSLDELHATPRALY